MKQISLTFLILLTCLTLGFSQETKVVLDSAFYHYGSNVSVNNLDLHRDWYYKYNDRVNLIESSDKHYGSSPGGSITRKFYNHNENELIDTTTIQKGNYRDSVFINYEMNVKSYNSNGLLISKKEFGWEDSYWDFRDEIIYSYDNQNRLIAETFYNGGERYFWDYNNDGYLLVKSWQYDDGGTWYPITQTTYVYDVQNNLIEETYLGNSSGNGYIEKEFYTYNSLNQRISRIHYTPDFNGIDLIPFIKDTMTYDSIGQLEEVLSAIYDNSGWLPYNGKRTYSYNTNGSLIEELRYGKDNNGNWYLSYKNGAAYDTQNRIIEQYSNWQWDTTTVTWRAATTKYLTYNNFNKLGRDLTHSWHNNSTGYHENFSQYTYYYSEKEVAEIPEPEPPIDSTDNNETCLFTNPYQPFTTVNCHEWEIDKTYQLNVFNFEGKLVYTKFFDGLNGFRVEKHLDNGWYVFVVLDNGEIVQKQKIWIY